MSQCQSSLLIFFLSHNSGCSHWILIGFHWFLLLKKKQLLDVANWYVLILLLFYYVLSNTVEQVWHFWHLLFLVISPLGKLIRSKTTAENSLLLHCVNTRKYTSYIKGCHNPPAMILASNNYEDSVPLNLFFLCNLQIQVKLHNITLI